MSKRNAQRLDSIFAALSDPIRREMVTRLASRELSVTALSEPFAVTPPAISKHLRVLEASGLISRRKAGRVHYCRLRTGPLREAGDWIEQQREFWIRQLKAFGEYLDSE